MIYCSGQLRNELSIAVTSYAIVYDLLRATYLSRNVKLNTFDQFKFVKVQVEYTAAAMAREPIGANGGLMVVQSSFTDLRSDSPNMGIPGFPDLGK